MIRVTVMKDPIKKQGYRAYGIEGCFAYLNEKTIMNEAVKTEMSRGEVLDLIDGKSNILANCDLSGLNFRGIVFKNLCVLCCNFQNVDFSGALFDNVLFIDCVCDNSRFNHAVFTVLGIHESNFNNVDFECSKIIDGVIRNSKFTNSVMSFTLFNKQYVVEDVFTGTYFYNVDFISCKIHSSHFDKPFRKTKFIDTDIVSSIGDFNIPMVCPEVGSFIGYKTALAFDDKSLIVTLEIPADARRSSATRRKCRCDKAKVLKIEDEKGNPVRTAYSLYDDEFKYVVGETVKVDDFCEDRYNECAPGIHFFMTKQEAMDYDFC